jgi:hypothetical protein
MITGTMMSSISAVEMTIRRACWLAMSPEGFITTVLHPANKAQEAGAIRDGGFEKP